MSITLILLASLGFQELLATRECRAVLDQRQYYTQFDAQNFNDVLRLPGSGTYLFSEKKYAINPDCNYRVEVNNGFSNDGPSTDSSITINFVSDVIFLGKNGILKINGIKKNVPYKAFHYTVQFSANVLTVKTDCEDEISFDGHHRVTVKADNGSGIEFRGLCGNNNGQNDDDCVDTNGDSLVDLSQYGRCPSFVFGVGFMIPNKTERICIELDATPLKLSKNYSDIAIGLDLCGHLDLTRNDSLFRLLIENEEAILDVELFEAVEIKTTTTLDICLYDVGRSLETGLDPMEGACDVINTYVNDVLAGIVVNMTMWREDGFCGIPA